MNQSELSDNVKFSVNLPSSQHLWRAHGQYRLQTGGHVWQRAVECPSRGKSNVTELIDQGESLRAQMRRQSSPERISAGNKEPEHPRLNHARRLL